MQAVTPSPTTLSSAPRGEPRDVAPEGLDAARQLDLKAAALLLEVAVKLGAWVWGERRTPA
jgi:hypothetical protein